MKRSFDQRSTTRQANLWTALPGIIESYDPVAMTAQVQCALTFAQTQPDGSSTPITMTVLTDVPLVFPRGGGHTLTFPIAAGDEVLLVFASRCIDSWWASGGIQAQREFRMHDLSDGFAIPGPFSLPEKLPGVSATTVQLRSNDGTNYIELDGSNGQVNVVTTASVNVTAPTVVVTGNLQVTGTVTAGYGGADAVTLQRHTHNNGPPPTAGT